MMDESSFVSLVETEYRGVMAASMMITGSSALAEEIVQDVFERTFVRWKKVSKLERPGAWVRRAVINQSISVARRTKSERRAVEALTTNTQHGASRGSGNGSGDVFNGFADTISLSGQELWRAVAELPQNQARAVALHYGADLAIADVGREMDMTGAAVKTLLYRARTALRDHSTVKEIYS